MEYLRPISPLNPNISMFSIGFGNSALFAKEGWAVIQSHQVKLNPGCD